MDDGYTVFALDSLDRCCGKTCPFVQGVAPQKSQNGTVPAARLRLPPWPKSREFWSPQDFLTKRVIQTRITAPTKATMMEPINPLSGQM